MFEQISTQLVPVEVTGTASDIDPSYPFAPLAEQAISDWVTANL